MNQLGVKYLYKYKKYDEKTLNLLCQDKIFAPSPVEFNDPFDCSFFHLHLLIEYIIIEAKRRGAINKSSFFDKFRGFISYLNNVKTNTGIFCLSKTNTNILMWAHYADNHQGFCMEFEVLEYANILGIKYIKRMSSFTEIQIKDLAIKIVDVALLGNTDHVIDVEFISLMENILQHKSDDWKHEKECRIIIDCKNNNRICSIEKLNLKLSSIIFGYKTSKNDIDKIKRLLKGKNINYKKIEPNMGKLQLHIKDI